MTDSDNTNQKKHGGGPKTAEGKARSAMNALKHGLAADTVVLTNEQPTQFCDLICGYFRDFAPQSDAEKDLITEMAICRWRLRRTWLIESAMFEMSMDRTEDAIDAEFDYANQACRLAAAWNHMAGDGGGYKLLNRYESRLSRRYDKALATFRSLKKERLREIGETNSPSAPAPEKCETNLPLPEPVVPDVLPDPQPPAAPDLEPARPTMDSVVLIPRREMCETNSPSAPAPEKCETNLPLPEPVVPDVLPDQPPAAPDLEPARPTMDSVVLIPRREMCETNSPAPAPPSICLTNAPARIALLTESDLAHLGRLWSS